MVEWEQIPAAWSPNLADGLSRRVEESHMVVMFGCPHLWTCVCNSISSMIFNSKSVYRYINQTEKFLANEVIQGGPVVVDGFQKRILEINS